MHREVNVDCSRAIVEKHAQPNANGISMFWIFIRVETGGRKDRKKEEEEEKNDLIEVHLN